MKFAYVAAEKAPGEFKVAEMCRALRLSTSSFYAWCKREPSTRTRKDEQLRIRVRASFEASRRTYGSPRVLEDLREGGERVERNRIIRLMREEGLQARARKRFKSTTMSDHGQPVAANVLDRQFDAAAPNQRWVGDTTQMLTTSGGRFYLAAIVDLYSRFCVEWAVSAINDRHLTDARARGSNSSSVPRGRALAPLRPGLNVHQ